MLVSLARNRISVKRQSTTGKSTVIDTTGIVDSLPTPFQPCSILLELGSTSTGSAVIEGTDNTDTSQSETLSFTSAKLRQGIKVFKTITRIVFTGLNGKNVKVKYRGLDGSSVKVQNVIYSCINAQISASRQNWNNDRSGTVENGNIKIMIPLYCANDENKIQAGDLIMDLESNQTYLATGMILEEGVGINRFQIVYAERRERT